MMDTYTPLIETRGTAGAAEEAPLSVAQGPSIHYQIAYPLPPAWMLQEFFRQIKEGSIDIVIIETLMSGLIPTKGDYPMSRFAGDCAKLVPTFFLPQDSKAD